MLAPLP
jgi:hypothetical protein